MLAFRNFACTCSSAGWENRTPVSSLEGSRFTTKLIPPSFFSATYDSSKRKRPPQLREAFSGDQEQLLTIILEFDLHPPRLCLHPRFRYRLLLDLVLFLQA